LRQIFDNLSATTACTVSGGTATTTTDEQDIQIRDSRRNRPITVPNSAEGQNLVGNTTDSTV
jgi:hypothetical protein